MSKFPQKREIFFLWLADDQHAAIVAGLFADGLDLKNKRNHLVPELGVEEEGVGLSVIGALVLEGGDDLGLFVFLVAFAERAIVMLRFEGSPIDPHFLF